MLLTIEALRGSDRLGEIEEAARCGPALRKDETDHVVDREHQPESQDQIGESSDRQDQHFPSHRNDEHVAAGYNQGHEDDVEIAFVHSGSPILAINIRGDL